MKLQLFNAAKNAVLEGSMRIAIFSQIEAGSKNYRRHMYNIPRIIF